MGKYQDNRAALAGAVDRAIARLNEFFVWWGDHRGWPANEPARLPLCDTARSQLLPKAGSNTCSNG